MTKRITACWKINNDSIVISCPSSSGGGNYLVGVTKSDNYLIVAHTCPAREVGNNCWHVKSAIEIFAKWQWWLKKGAIKHIKNIKRKITLNPEWEQIPIPGEQSEELLGIFKVS